MDVDLMTLKTTTTKTLATTMIVAAGTFGGGSIAAADTTSPAEASSAPTPGTTAEAGQQAGATDPQKKFSSIGAFLKHYKGQSLANSQGTFKGECVSLISRALEEVHGVDHDAWGDAVDYQKGGSGGKKMAQNGFTWHTDQKFENGDILVWGNGANTTSYGHIGIYYEGQVWHQNFNNNRTLHTYDGLIDGYLGYWRA